MIGMKLDPLGFQPVEKCVHFRENACKQETDVYVKSRTGLSSLLSAADTVQLLFFSFFFSFCMLNSKHKVLASVRLEVCFITTMMMM